MEALNCDVCGKDVKIEDGVLSISFKKIREVQDAEAVFKLNHPGPVLDVGEVMAFPDRVPWRWNHIGCSRDSSYDIEATRFDNLRKALHWTIHLQDKTWFRYTDWREVIHRLYPECDVENDKSR